MTSTTGSGALALAVRGLRKKYGSRPALVGLDLSVPEGVVYGFLGPNGAGKTTTMRILTGLIRADGGAVELFGKEYHQGDRRRLFNVGALVETPSFYPFLSGRQNLRELSADGAHVSKGRVDELLELMGLRDRANDKYQSYSLGMKQRLGIAAALLNDPQLLLLDEPANGLDPAGIVAMRETLRHLAAIGKTVFVSSHILGEVRQMADVVGIIAAGRLVQEGPIESLLAAGGAVRVRVSPADLERAMNVLRSLTDVTDGTEGSDATDGVRKLDEPGWISVQVGADRTADVNRALGNAGIWALGLEAGDDLESRFLALTGAERTAMEQGSFFGVAGAQAAEPNDAEKAS
jgi:ABC-2 type transport system ATP-binding protein